MLTSGSSNTNGGGAPKNHIADGSTTEYSFAFTGISISNVTFKDNIVMLVQVM